jgi:3-hydroxyacyl-CoA dehydrogenase
MTITRLGIVGAGTMGSGIAALAVSAGIPVLLLDVPGTGGDRNGPATAGLTRTQKAKPAAFMDKARADAITIGNTEDDFARLADCDLVIEAIIEQVEPKRALYARLENTLKPTAIVASNTSGIPMRTLTEGRSERFRSHFLGMHFFNPPRYLHLLEIIPTPDTDAKTIEGARRFSDQILGKGIVVARDVPGFVANRLGVFGMVLAVRLMEQYRLSIDDVDLLTGALLARAKSATFRTADLTGIDVLGHVTAELAESTGDDFTLPPWIQALVTAGHVGEKSGAGFYKKIGKEIQTLDWRSGDYRAQTQPDLPGLKALSKLAIPERFAAIRDWSAPQADFAREYLLRFSHYVLATTPVIAYDLPSVDHAMEWGFAWEIGPFKQMDLLGAEFLRTGFARYSLDEPDLLKRAKNGFYGSGGRALSVTGGNGEYVAVPVDPEIVSLGALRNATASRASIMEESPDATLWNVGDVAILEVHSKMNTLGAAVVAAIHSALDLVESKALLGLVIGNEDPRTFTAGADLMMIARLAEGKEWGQLDEAVRRFQATSMRIRQSPFPVVAAPFGLTLGGGTEFSLHADVVQAHAELYMGLVEIGVGLIPAGGGTKELLFRFTRDLEPYREADPFEAVRRAFQVIAMATMSTSALEARSLGFLRPTDRITMNRDRLLSDAVHRVRELASAHVPPLPQSITALGKEGLGNLHYAAWAMREAGQITDFEVTLGREVAYVLTAGDGPSRTVSEQDILDLERDAFLRLLGTKETRERIDHMLKTGKPLRN